MATTTFFDETHVVTTVLKVGKVTFYCRGGSIHETDSSIILTVARPISVAVFTKAIPRVNTSLEAAVTWSRAVWIRNTL